MQYSTGELADLLGVPRDAIRNAVQLGKLQPPAVKVGGHYAWQKSDVTRARRLFAARAAAKAARKGKT